MAGHIYPKKIKGRTYYYYQESYREKIGAGKGGKGKGSGKSRVRSRSIYLGTAETILTCKQKVDGPATVRHRSFGLVAAAYQTAGEIGLIEALQKHIRGKRCGIDRWAYFLLTIINRLDCATSKNKMGAWAKKTVLPELLGFDPKKLTGKNYWYATDDVISEAELKKRRKEKKSDPDDLFCDLDDKVFVDIEADIFSRLRPRFDDRARSLVYDTTNFFTYFESPDASELARRGHNKDSRHHLRQVGLAMAVDQALGIPFFHRVYQGSRHDAPTFSGVVGDLIANVGMTFKGVDELVLVLDKGNNSKTNFDFLSGKIEWVGSLVPSQHEDMLSTPVEDYDGAFGDMNTLRKTKKVMGCECALVMTYNPKLARKQEHTLQNGIAKLEKSLRGKYTSYKRTPVKMTAGLKTVLSESRYKNCVKVFVDRAGMRIERDEAALAKRRKPMGKNLIFTSKIDAETSWMITNYKEKDIIEDGFKQIKDPNLIRIRPPRHWTDTKIRAFVFCCVMSFLLIRIMQNKAERAGLAMSPKVLKEELADLKEVIMIYENGRAERKISEGSSVQKKLAKSFDLCKIEKTLTLH